MSRTWLLLELAWFSQGTMELFCWSWGRDCQNDLKLVWWLGLTRLAGAGLVSPRWLDWEAEVVVLGGPRVPGAGVPCWRVPGVAAR